MPKNKNKTGTNTRQSSHDSDSESKSSADNNFSASERIFDNLSSPEVNSSTDPLTSTTIDANFQSMVLSMLTTIQSDFSSLNARLDKIDATVQVLTNLEQSNVTASVLTLETDYTKLTSKVSGVESQLSEFKLSTLHDHANDSKNYHDLSNRVSFLESSNSDSVPTRLLHSINATMDKVVTTMTIIQKSSAAQLIAQRNSTEMAFNHVTAPSDDSFLTMLLSLHSFRKYKNSGGTLTFLDIVERSPDVLEIYLEKAIKNTYPSFEFTRDDDTVFFTELIQHVFHPDGITISVFNEIVATKKMSEFSIQSASAYKIWIFFLVRVLHDHLPDSITPQLWDKVAKNAFPPGFQHSLLAHPPRTLRDFPKTIETRAAVFRDRETSNSFCQQSATSTHTAGSDRSPPVDASRLLHSSPMPGLRDRGRTINNISTRDVCFHCRTSEHSTPDCPLLHDHSEDSEDD